MICPTMLKCENSRGKCTSALERQPDPYQQRLLPAGPPPQQRRPQLMLSDRPYTQQQPRQSWNTQRAVRANMADAPSQDDYQDFPDSSDSQADYCDPPEAADSVDFQDDYAYDYDGYDVDAEGFMADSSNAVSPSQSPVYR